MKERLKLLFTECSLFFGRAYGKVTLAVAVLCSKFFVGMPAVVLAAKGDDDTTSASSNEVVDGIGNLETLVLACVEGVGIIFLAWGILDFGTAYASHESSQQSQAIKKIVGGLIMCFVPVILTVLGITNVGVTKSA